MPKMVLDIVNTLILAAPCFVLILMIFWDKRKTSPPMIALGILVYSLIVFLSSRIFGAYKFSTMLHAFISMVAMLVSISFFCFFIKYNFCQSIFIIAVIKCYVENVRLFSYYLCFLFSTDLTSIPPLWITIFKAVFTVVTFPLIYQFSKKMLRPALDCSPYLKIWNVLWAVPVLNSVIYSLVIAPKEPISNYQPDSVFYFAPPLWTLLTFITIAMQLMIITTMAENSKLQETLRLSEMQVAAQQKQNELFQKRIDETSRLRHDIRHHILALDELVKEQDLDGIRNYLKEVSIYFPSSLPHNYCSSSVVNAFLGFCKDAAEKAFIETSYSISLPDKIPIPDNDLCIILGNLMENAVEACRRMQDGKRYIRLVMSASSPRTLVIICENSYSGNIRRLPDGKFLSSKAAGRQGIGISSIINVTEKYNGVHRFEYHSGNFKVSLLLNAKAQP